MVAVPNAGDVLGWLDQVDSNLKKVTTYLDTIFEDIESCPQATVDYLCERAGDYATYVLNYGKVKVLNGLGTQKKAIDDITAQYGELSVALTGAMVPPTTLPTCITWAASMITLVKKMYNIVITPYQDAVEFITNATDKILSISNSMQQIASYTPPTAPDINFDKFKIDFTPFSISDIGTNIPYPDPPEVKPFPNPFTNSSKDTTNA